VKVAIVGAGIAGLSTAWALTARGHAVTLIEQGPIPNPLGASGDHHRIIRRAYSAASGYAGVITEAYQAWDALWADIGTSHLDPRGFLCVSREAGDEAEIYRDGLEQGGYPLEVLDADAAARHFAFLEPGTFRYAFTSPEGGALHCRRIAVDVVNWLRRRGATVLEGARVTHVDGNGGRVRLASGEAIEADRVVVTAGAWVTKLFTELTSALTTYRTAVVYLDPPADLAEAWARAPVILDVGGATDGYIIPPSGGAGLKFGTGLHKVRNADADMNRIPAPGEGEIIRDHFQRPLARIDEYRVRDVVTCAYTFTADERFFCDDAGGSLVVSACSGHGYKFGAAVGRRVADAVESGDVPFLKRWLRAKA